MSLCGNCLSLQEVSNSAYYLPYQWDATSFDMWWSQKLNVVFISYSIWFSRPWLLIWWTWRRCVRPGQTGRCSHRGSDRHSDRVPGVWVRVSTDTNLLSFLLDWLASLLLHVRPSEFKVRPSWLRSIYGEINDSWRHRWNRSKVRDCVNLWLCLDEFIFVAVLPPSGAGKTPPGAPPSAT